MMRRLLLPSLLLTTLCGPLCAGMDDDPEAGELLTVFSRMSPTATYLDDTFDKPKERKITGPIGFGPGRGAEDDPADKALLFPDERIPETHVYYGPYVPMRGVFCLDFRLDTLPRDNNFMALFSIGTPGNTCFTVRLYLDRTVRATLWTKRERVTTLSDPVELGQWHALRLYYGPEGSLLQIDGAIEDYSTDYSVPYAHNNSNAFYLGDQPWWDGNKRKGIFYPLDGFVGRLDNLRLERLEAVEKR